MYKNPLVDEELSFKSFLIVNFGSFLVGIIDGMLWTACSLNALHENIPILTTYALYIGYIFVLVYNMANSKRGVYPERWYQGTLKESLNGVFKSIVSIFTSNCIGWLLSYAYIHIFVFIMTCVLSYFL